VGLDDLIGGNIHTLTIPSWQDMSRCLNPQASFMDSDPEADQDIAEVLVYLYEEA
jgi:hypothetical protein